MYVLEKKYRKYKTDEVLELIGYPVKIAKHDIVVFNQDLIDKLILKKIIPDFNRLVKKVLVFIEEDSNPDSAVLFLDELAKLYIQYLNKYEKHLSRKEKEKFMRDMRLITNELKSVIHKKSKSVAIEHGRRR